ncbi:MAG: DNA-directed RNA polymerase subunit alpha [Candidatus Magasanikbacteria bacterium GW2011_GWA2_56_11]|uniref:DNA-directed RNA polymerase subunit alpha n=1 Tax=Candidatus Magasanikbacteria bacterium GW2011_GWA2_56_11 TaxID=1619044 RepID=A0A0G2AK76_9BACT|nr:MAG: DNA-directed RNA polymerase subunit alpha [Candidatus Magasanikbacteria bacterium GW2011_GWA2_56_11]
MAHILLPSTLEFQKTDNPLAGKLVITPCHQGYGTTLGNALRRVLLSSIPGAAVEAVKIEGVQHEFSAIPGVLEDAIQVILNLKQLALISHAETPVKLELSKTGMGPVTAADFAKNADIEVLNSELLLATLTDEKTPFNMEVIVGRGLGYIPAADKSSKNLDLGTMLVDSFYSPVKDVGYDVENTRVGDITDYEKLTVSIETNGTITPKEAVRQATDILMNHFRSVLEAAEARED